MYNLFIFFRDYRIRDNLGLIEALNTHKKVLPIFIFVDDQISPKKNEYFSNNSVQFLCESLNELNEELLDSNKELYTFHGSNILQVLENIRTTINIEGIHYNMDYTPYALKRQDKLKHWCNKNDIDHHVYEDYLLAPIGSFLKADGNYYGIYTPFKNNVYNQVRLIPKPKQKTMKNIISLNEIKKSKYYINPSHIVKFYKHNPNILVRGGRKEALKLLNKTRSMKYDEMRNNMIFDTSHLSAYIKYGVLSIREVFWYFYKHEQQGLMDQIIWREFYFYVTYYNPRLLEKGENYNKKYDKIKWVKNNKNLEAWKNGVTGYPIVDACMKELNTTGYMHNRGRLISSNFLNRILGLDWRLGEKYFAQQLTDYDPCVNNGNWQWIASTGTDPKPYFQRLFNPWLQSSKFDGNADYIKKWLPQLKDIPAKHLHQWDIHAPTYKLKDINYVKPIIDYSEARKRSVTQYRM